MLNHKMFILFIVYSIISGTSSQTSGKYRTDYVYNRRTNAYYKLHTEFVRQWDTKKVCEVEGAQLMVPTSDLDIAQLHGMMKRMPDIEMVWVGQDGLEHESAEEPAIIDLSENTDSEENRSYGKCEVCTREGKLEMTPCYKMWPFICKVDAKDAYYDSECGVYAKNYQYEESTGSCYKLARVAYTWNQAYAECKAEGAHLVVLNSEAEQRAVQSYVQAQPGVTGAFNTWFFLAGFRADTPVDNSTKIFKTIFNETLDEAGFAVWSPNEPNNAQSNEDCGCIFKNDGKLNDIGCNVKFGFVCEKETQ